MNRRDSFKAATAGLLGALCPWGVKAEDKSRGGRVLPMVEVEARPANLVMVRKVADCECCQMEPSSWTVYGEQDGPVMMDVYYVRRDGSEVCKTHPFSVERMNQLET